MAGVVVVGLWVQPASAASTFTVTGTGDPGGAACAGTVCDSLRAAVAAADAAPGSTVQLDAATYTLSQSALVITPNDGSVTIVGAGDSTGGTAIEQTHAGDRVVRITGTGQVTIRSVLITGGDLTGANGGAGAAGGNASGGGIFNGAAQLTLDHAAVTNNTATAGDGGTGNGGSPQGGAGGQAAGGIFSGGQLTLIDSTVSLNVAKAGAAGDGAPGNASGNGGFGGDATGGILEDNPSGPTAITGSTITGNKATGGAAGNNGGGCCAGGGGTATGAMLHDAQGLTITGTTISSNTATGGAGITTNSTSSGGTARGGLVAATPTGPVLTVDGSTFAANTARGGTGGTGGFALGGALTVGGMTGTVSASTFTGNHATAGNSNGGNPPSIGGGGVFEEAGTTLTVTNTSITENVLTGSTNSSGSGGSVCGAGLGSEGYTTLIGDTVSANTATGGPRPSGGFGGPASGAGLCLDVFGTTVVLNSTITGNLALGGGSAGGGGIELQAGGADLANDTVAGNSASAGPGGTVTGGNVLVVPAAGTTLTLADTIIANGTVVGSATNGNCSVAPAQVVDQGHNLESSTPSQCGLSAGDVLGADPLLGAPAANGGPTQTMLLAPGSPAIGAGGACVDPTGSGSPGLAIDQRGLPRSAVCDIGAVQVQRPVNSAAPAITGTPAAGQTLTCTQGTWAGDGMLSFSDQWQRDGAPVAGATASSYAVTSTDEGHALSCAVTASSPYGSALATSGAVVVPVPTPVALAPPLAKPTLTHVAQTGSTWRRSSRTATIASARSHKRPPVGTAFSFTLNTAATVTLTFTHHVGGRRSAGRCVTPSRHTRHDPRCTRTVTAGTLTFARVAAGARKVRFAGRISRHTTLAAGAYAVTIAAANAAGHATAKALHFTIVSS